jgi:hypothetical protein
MKSVGGDFHRGVFAARKARRVACMSEGARHPACEKNGIFEPFIHKNDHFAKTGSGQT